MKKILVTGKSGYIAGNLAAYLKSFGEEYQVDSISLRQKEPNEINFTSYDVIVHLAGIAHVSARPSMKEEYFRVNRDLAVKTARWAKKSGVPHFIFMSSIIIYSHSSLPNGVITKETLPRSHNFYGSSKLQADKAILSMSSEKFAVTSVRCPMVYGQGCGGNFPRLSKLAKLGFFPGYPNKRSMIYIENLCEYLRLVVDNRLTGARFPQNREYVSTLRLVKAMAEIQRRSLWTPRFFNPVIAFLANKIDVFHKVFGDLVYDKNLSDFDLGYHLWGFNKSVERSVET